MRSRNMKKTHYNEEVKTTFYFSGLEKKGGTMLDAAEERTTTSAASDILFVEEKDFHVHVTCANS